MKYYISILAIALAISSCNKHYPAPQQLVCPPYNPAFLNTWFPYEDDHTYYYKDSIGNRHWLAIENVSYSDGDEPGGCVMPTECIPSGTVFAYRDVNQQDKIWLSATHHINKDGERLDLHWNSISVYILVNNDGTLSLDPLYYGRTEDYYQEIKPAFAHYDKVQLNAVEYTDVYEIVFAKNDMGNARKLYLAKDHGIVGYQTQDGASYWME
jgi:hypothetical protein